MSLTREAILKADDLPREKVPVPEWGGDVFVRTMTGVERDAYEQKLIREKGENEKLNMENLRGLLAAMTVVDDKGNRIFADTDAPELGRKSSLALTRIFDVAIRLNGLTKSEVDELAKKSPPGPTSDSPTV